MIRAFILCAFASFIASTSIAQSDDEQIRAVLETQRLAWNEGDIETYMEGYWNDEQLSFVGSRGVTRGWAQTLANYQKSYASKEEMGQLTFDLVEVQVLSDEYGYVIGKWHLAREGMDDLGGAFTLLLRKIDGQWRIISDHSS